MRAQSKRGEAVEMHVMCDGLNWHPNCVSYEVAYRTSPRAMSEPCQRSFCQRLLRSSTTWVEAETCSDKYMNNASEQETGHTKV